MSDQQRTKRMLEKLIAKVRYGKTAAGEAISQAKIAQADAERAKRHFEEAESMIALELSNIEDDGLDRMPSRGTRREHEL